MQLDLKGKKALITGGSDGIGLEVASAFAEEGTHVGICGRDPHKLERALEGLRSKGVDAVGVPVDVTSRKQAKLFVEECVGKLGGIDILVNNVGGSVGGSLQSSTDEDWLATFELNVFQSIRMIRLASAKMEHGGSIVNISSISGWHPQLSGTLQYGAAKAALIYLAEPLALQLAESRIRVNTVSPGSILWEGGGWSRYRDRQPAEFAAYRESGYPFGRLGTTEEIADVVVFLSSERASWINGRHIAVDGVQQPVPAKDKRLW